MKTAIRSWRRERRYRAMVSSLRALPASELKALGIAPAEIVVLAEKASQL